MTTFRSELNRICSERGITIKALSKKIGIVAARVSVMGDKKGIAYHDLNKIIKVLKADALDTVTLRHLAKYTMSRKPIIINDEFINAVTQELIANDSYWNDCKQVCQAILKFAGVKTKVK